eukprot:3412784-Rhodomonas_salina.4
MPRMLYAWPSMSPIFAPSSPAPGRSEHERKQNEPGKQAVCRSCAPNDPKVQYLVQTAPMFSLPLSDLSLSLSPSLPDSLSPSLSSFPLLSGLSVRV